MQPVDLGQSKPFFFITFPICGIVLLGPENRLCQMVKEMDRKLKDSRMAKEV